MSVCHGDFFESMFMALNAIVTIEGPCRLFEIFKISKFWVFCGHFWSFWGENGGGLFTKSYFGLWKPF